MDSASEHILGSDTKSESTVLSSVSISNFQGLKPLTVQSSVLYLKGNLLQNNHLFVILTETWLREHKDAEIHIDGYKIFRADRVRPKSKFRRSSGGVTIYIKEDFAATFKPMLSFSNGVIEILLLYSEYLNTVICGLYRQPDDTQHGNLSTSKEFKEVMDLLTDKLDSLLQGKTPDIFMAGDFNLPHINWENDSFHPGISKDKKVMANQLSELMND